MRAFPPLLVAFYLLAGFSVLTGCAYRFTNTAITPPAGIRTVAVEAIYDTSREVLPHEVLWDELQKAIAANGRLTLVSATEADALLRAHITSARINPTGSTQQEKPEKDPQVTRSNKPPPNEFRALTRAGEWTTSEALGFSVQVELWDLRTHKLIFKNQYSGNRDFKSVLAEGAGGVQKSMQYLIYEESLNNRFKEISKQIASKVVTDIFL